MSSTPARPGARTAAVLDPRCPASPGALKRLGRTWRQATATGNAMAPECKLHGRAACHDNAFLGFAAVFAARSCGILKVVEKNGAKKLCGRPGWLAQLAVKA